MNNFLTIDWRLLGAKLATLTCVEQSEFFKGFGDELKTFESNCAIDRQMFFIRDRLSDKHKEFLKEYLPSIWFDGVD